MIKPEDYAAVTRAAMADGYTAVKVDPLALSNREPDGRGPWKMNGILSEEAVELAYDRVAAMREAGGRDLDIIIELHSYTDTLSTVQLGQRLEKLRIFYLEEPCTPLNPGNMLEVHRQVNIPIASGERIYQRTGFRPFLEDRSLQVVQPDVCLCGGISEAKITNNVVLVAYLLRMIIGIATLRLPTLYKEQWEKSFIHLPDPIFYGITIIAILAQLYMVYLSAKSMSVFMVLCCVGFVIFCICYAFLRYKSGKVQIKSVKDFQ